MSSLLNKAGMALFERHLEQYAPADPMYETYTDNKGKQKRRRREIPPGLSKRDAKILKSVQRRAHYLDKGFSLCGFRFGWTFVIGLIPGAGDAADAALNYLLVVRKAKQADLPSWLVRKMLMNNAVSAAVGFIPLAGDVILAAFKANSRNAALLEEFLRIRGEEFIKLGGSTAVADAAAAPTTKDQQGKGKGKTQEVTKGVTKSDAEQVKPGAGVDKGEKVLAATTPGKVPGGLSDVTAAAEPASGSKLSSSGSGKSMGRKGFGSFFARKAPEAGEKGRFVENVDNKNKN
ncbi:hypothetical protein K435DRAFT_654506 [Dendrothele bispora CBS 962.96]|uniref:DUF4112 domain-containing protein n=1 Tax=Dendrothele bispora (strain CBS 962.96) TaxID=1314807 RepID=A0A4S8MGW0_DENBC|nr:hypothetical protein K435DRAFT_654506 [Dendrothele bispora CBS 962.96]